MASSDFEVVSTADAWSVVDGAPAAEQLQIEVALERDVAPLEETALKAVVSCQAPKEAELGRRAPLRLVAVLDKSGSMAGEKLRLVKQTMVFMWHGRAFSIGPIGPSLRYLSERDSLGIVEYGSDVRVCAPLTLCDQGGRDRLKAAVEKIETSGQTNLSGGLLKGLELHREPVKRALEQTVQVGNLYRQLAAPEPDHFGYGDAALPEGAARVHEWTMQLRFGEYEGLVNKVIFHLHPTFRDAAVEVAQPPFELKRVGWGTFEIAAQIFLKDGRELKVSHMLSFDSPASFRPVLLPLREAPPSFWGLCGGPQVVPDDEPVVRSTFLFTDGHANCGIRDAEGICQATVAMLAELKTCKSSVSTFGFGGDHNAEMLRRLADCAEGSYSHVQSEDQIAESFGEALGGLMSTTHQNVTLSLELAPGVSLSRALTSYPVDRAGGRVTVDLGDLFAEERRDVLLELRLPAASEGLQAVARAELRGFAVSEKRLQQVQRPLVLERRAGAPVAASHPQVERQWQRHLAQEALAAARAAADGGDLEAGRRVLDAALAQLGASPLTAQGDGLCLGLVGDLQDCRADLSHKSQYMQVGSKKMAMMQGIHGKQKAAPGFDTHVDLSNCKMKQTRAAFKMNIA